MSWIVLRRLPLLVAALAAPLAAQERPPAPAPAPAPTSAIGLLGEVLRRAQEEGAIGRLAGERWFRLQGKQGGDALLLVRVVPSTDPPRVVLDTVLTTLGQDPHADMNTQVLLGPDGRMQAFRSALRLSGRGESRAEGRVVGPSLNLVVDEPGQERREDQKPWSPDAIPGQALMFVLPCLYEFLPADRSEVLQFDESVCRVAPRRLLRAQSDPLAQGPPLVTVRLVHPDDEQSVQFEARVDPRGKIIELRRDQSLLRAIESSEAQRLLAAERERQAAPPPGLTPMPPPPTQPAPGGTGGAPR